MSAPVVIPRATVPPPTAATPHLYGLLTVAAVQENADGRELTGVEYESVCSPRVDPYPAACRPGDETPRTKDPHPTTAVTNGTPFAVYAADSCLLGRDERTARQQLRDRLRLGEETAVESAIETGDVANFPNLVSAEVIGTAAVDLLDAFGLLEQALSARFGTSGVIHAPMWLAPRAHHMTLWRPAGQRAQTVLGSSVAFGAGYTGQPPAAYVADEDVEDDGELWLYATGPVTVRRSQLIEPGGWTEGGFDRRQNLGFLLTERIYVVDWPCAAVAVRVDMQRDRAGTPAQTVGLINWYQGAGPPVDVPGAKPGDMYYDSTDAAFHQAR